MNHRLAREIAQLRALLIDMVDLVVDQYSGAVEALMQQDPDLAERVIARDDEVDALEMEVDRRCERIIALYHPVAVDLRMLLTVEKINTDLERMGDHCRNVARNVAPLVAHPDVLARTQLRDMAAATRRMLHDARQAFHDRDETLADRVNAYDAEVNRLYRENFQALVEHCQQHPEDAEPTARLITANKAFERISDHAKNIAKAVIFLIQGVDTRHPKVRQKQKARAGGRDGR